MTNEAGTIQQDVPEFDGEAAFLSSFDDESKKRAPSETDEGAPEAQHETDEPEGTEAGEPEAPDDDDPDNQEVEIKVGEETKKATLRELKRLFGQEAALTQKSQRIAEATRQAEEALARNTAATKSLLERAQERYKPYSELDTAAWVYLAQNMSGPEYQELRAASAAAKADVDFLTTELDGHMKAQTEASQKAMRDAAAACIVELQDPVKGIKDFGKPLYDEMMNFAREQGVPEMVQVTSPGAIRLLHMAMQFAKSQKAAKQVEDKVQQAVAKPARTLRPGAAPQKSGKEGLKAAMDRLKADGSDEDAAVGAFLATLR